jgi:ribose 5-phosphate isomerase A
MTAENTTSPPAPAAANEVSLPPAIASRKLSPQTPKEVKNKLSPIEYAKRMAAHRAVDAHVKEHHRVIGIGSGSTVPYVVERILEMGEKANKRRWVSAF